MQWLLASEHELPEGEEKETRQCQSGRQGQYPSQEQVAHRPHCKPEEFAIIVPATPEERT